jgi:transcription antitermination factor NusG
MAIACLDGTTPALLTPSTRKTKSLEKWFALRVKSRGQEWGEELLRSKGYECFSPRYVVRTNWSDRVKVQRKPLFPGYSFCRFNPLKRIPILETPGVIGIVGAGRDLIAIDEREIEAIRAIYVHGIGARPHPHLVRGQRVRIEYGVLRGVEGILIRVTNQARVVLSVSVLCRSVSVEVAMDQVHALKT